MANAFEENVFRIDTVPVTLFSASERARIAKFRWVGATNAAHTVVVQNLDSSPVTIWEDAAMSADHTSESDGPFDLRDGVVVATLGSGVLYVYLE